MEIQAFVTPKLPKMAKSLPYGFQNWKKAVVWAKRHETGAWLYIREMRIVEDGIPQKYEVVWSDKASLRTRYAKEVESYIESRHEADREAAIAWVKGPPNFVIPFKSHLARDTQRNKLYRWERAFAFNDKFNQEQVVALAHRICTDMGWKVMPRVKFTKTSGAHSTHLGMELNFSKSSCTKQIVCHEVAHSLNSQELKNVRHAGHGPEFVTKYIELLVRYCDMDAAALVASARQAKLKLAPSSYLSEKQGGAQGWYVSSGLVRYRFDPKSMMNP